MSRLFAIIVFGCAMSCGCMAATPQPPKPQDPAPEPAKVEPPVERREQDQPQQRVERAMNWLKENDPNKARVLDGIRTSDPNRFNRELQEYFRQRMRNEGFDWSLLGPGDRRPGGPGLPGGGEMGPFGDRGGRGDPKALMEKEREDFMKWLKANYPEEEKQLVELKKTEKDPAKIDRATMQHYRQYMNIYVASKYSPKLAEILKQDLPLRKLRRDLAAKIEKTADAAEKAKLTEQLRDVVTKRFGLLVQQKQVEYDILLERLKTVQKQIEDSKSKLEELKQNSKQRIEEQMTELLTRKEKPPQDKPPQEKLPQDKTPRS
jgi:hypothetical protein